METAGLDTESILSPRIIAAATAAGKLAARAISALDLLCDWDMRLECKREHVSVRVGSVRAAGAKQLHSLFAMHTHASLAQLLMPVLVRAPRRRSGSTGSKFLELSSWTGVWRSKSQQSISAAPLEAFLLPSRLPRVAARTSSICIPVAFSSESPLQPKYI